MHEEKDKINHKKALEINAYVAGAGAFGVFFRWMQRQLAFEDGLVKGSVWNVIVPLSILVVGYVFLRFVDRFKNERCYLPDELEEALVSPGKLYTIVRWAVGILMCVGALAVLATCETDKNAVMLRVVALLAGLSGLSFPLLLSAANRKRVWMGPKVLCLFSFLPILLFAVWLILSYKENAINSVIWDYSIEIISAWAWCPSSGWAASLSGSPIAGAPCSLPCSALSFASCLWRTPGISACRSFCSPPP